MSLITSITYIVNSWILTGIFGGNTAVCAQVMWETLIDLSDQLNGNLEQLHIVDIIDNNIKEILDQAKSQTFEQKILRDKDGASLKTWKVASQVGSSWQQVADINPFGPSRSIPDQFRIMPVLKPSKPFRTFLKEESAKAPKSS